MNGGIEVADLCFSYAEQKILHEITFDVQSGQLVTILGPNGSGKTTLLKCINLLLQAEGSIQVDGTEISKISSSELAKKIGYVPQAHTPAFPYRVLDVVVSGRTPYLGLSAPQKEDYELGYQMVKQVGIDHLAEKPYIRLSGGELRLVLLARALVQQSRVLLLDEPTSNLDMKNRILVLKVLKGIVEQGVAVLMTEHDPNLASLFSDRVLLMYEGRLLRYGHADDVLSRENIMEVYGIDVEIFRNNGNHYIFPVV
ncbi:MAG: ABC transporter ATP-binding protein [Methanoculleaceae archaeon]